MKYSYKIIHLHTPYLQYPALFSSELESSGGNHIATGFRSCVCACTLALFLYTKHSTASRFITLRWYLLLLRYGQMRMDSNCASLFLPFPIFNSYNIIFDSPYFYFKLHASTSSTSPFCLIGLIRHSQTYSLHPVVPSLHSFLSASSTSLSSTWLRSILFTFSSLTIITC